RAAYVRGALVLHRHHRDRRGAAHRQQPGGALQLPARLPDLRGRAGRAGAVVVRPQRRRLLPYHAVPRADVLLPPEGGQPPGVLVPAVHRPLLEPRLHLHLGRAAPPQLYRRARMGRHAGHDLLRDAVDAVVGRHDQRALYAARRVAQAARLGGAEDVRRGDHVLRHGDLRGADAERQDRQRAEPLYRLEHRARTLGRAGLERLPDVRDDLLAPAEAVAHRTVEPQAGQRALL